eukprot:m51a1_g9539 putative rho gtpase-activating protein 35 (565) ;mRNA; f:834755-836988
MSADVAMTHLIEVRVHRGRNLAKKDLNGYSDPYVLIKINRAEVFRSRRENRTLDPVWPEAHALVVATVTHQPLIEVEVWDWDALSPPDFMGLCCPSIPPVAGDPIWMPLKGRTAKDKVRGDVLVSVRSHAITYDSHVRAANRHVYRCLVTPFADTPLVRARLLCLHDSALRGCAELGSRSAVTLEPDLVTVSLYSTPSSARVQLRANSADDARRLVQALEPFVGSVSSGGAPGQAPIFGSPLAAVAARERADAETEVPWFIAALIQRVRQSGLGEVGLFRVSGSSERMERARAQLEAHREDFLGDPELTVNDAACLLKEYLRTLPEPLVTRVMYSPLLEAHGAGDVAAVQELLLRIPETNQHVLREVMRLMYDVALRGHTNMMKPSNLGIVIGPSIMWPPAEEGPLGALSAVPRINALAATLIEQFPMLLDGCTRRQALTKSGHLEARAERMVAQAVLQEKRLLEQETAPNSRPQTFREASTQEEEAAEDKAEQIFDQMAGKSGCLEGSNFDACIRKVIESLPGSLAGHFDTARVRQLMQVYADNDKVTKDQFLAWWGSCLRVF